MNKRIIIELVNLHSVLWDRNVIYKTKTKISQSIIKSMNVYAAETFKIQKYCKLNSTEMDF